MEFDYFYNRDGERFSYCMLPKIFVTDGRFKTLSSDAKILYSCLLERTSLLYRNKWLDEKTENGSLMVHRYYSKVIGRFDLDISSIEHK